MASRPFLNTDDIVTLFDKCSYMSYDNGPYIELAESFDIGTVPRFSTERIEVAREEIERMLKLLPSQFHKRRGSQLNLNNGIQWKHINMLILMGIAVKAAEYVNARAARKRGVAHELVLRARVLV